MEAGLLPAHVTEKDILEGAGRRRAGDVPAKDLDLDPVVGDEGTVAEREELAQVRTAPEEVRRDTRGRQLQTIPSAPVAQHKRASTYVARREERQVRDGPIRTNIRERALVRVLERTQLLRLRDLALERLDADLALLLALGVRLALELLELRAQRVALRELLEDAREVRALLRRDLRGRRVRRRRAVADREDAVARARHPQALCAVTCQSMSGLVCGGGGRTVDGDASAVRLLRGELGHEVAGDLAEGVALRREFSN